MRTEYVLKSRASATTQARVPPGGEKEEAQRRPLSSPAVPACGILRLAHSVASLGCGARDEETHPRSIALRAARRALECAVRP